MVSCPSGVIGSKMPCTAEKAIITCSGAGGMPSGSGKSEVIGPRLQQVELASAHAHSMSCGEAIERGDAAAQVDQFQDDVVGDGLAVGGVRRRASRVPPPAAP